jgi:hypothetical protein
MINAHILVEKSVWKRYCNGRIILKWTVWTEFNWCRVASHGG